MTVHLSTTIDKLTRVGKITALKLSKLGIQCAKDLLEHYPSRFEDYSAILNIDCLSEGSIGTIFGQITKIETKKTPKIHMRLTEAHLSDKHGIIKLIWFNQPYIADTIREGDKISVAGKIERDWQGWAMKNPSYEKATTGREAVHTARLVPIYPLTSGLTSKQIRFLVSQSLEASGEFIDILPDDIRKKSFLRDKASAIKSAHLPSSSKDYLEAMRSLKFEELFIIQIQNAKAREKLSKERAPKIKFNEQKTKDLVASLPFKLTLHQRKAAWDIIKDMGREIPMNRLLQGEVGSGKTVVAAIAALNAAENRFQSAFMAPTEILGLQHFETITKIFPDKRIALLTNKYNRLNVIEDTASRGNIKQRIANGQIDIIIGTHAIIQKDVIFNNLGLVIIDEQHHFGVEQRKALKDKSPLNVPHLLSMTATPIPRSLALTLYGDLDISTIRQMPAGRKKIATRIVEEKNRAKAYGFIKQKIKQGEQTFVVCPIIEESDALGVKSAAEEYEKLKKTIFPDIPIGLMHGRLKSDEKESAMRDFKTGKTSILVSTSVVEVGVDVPNASIMIIEGSDRFGLSQLHQFRGRVGRGRNQAYCFLFTDSNSEQTKHRLRKFINAKDGFEIAELDLQLRGPGQIYGTMQSGRFSDLKAASLADSGLISETKKCAKELLDQDPNLGKHPLLRSEIESHERKMYLE